MSIRRVALIYDNRLRPDTTGGYVRRALAGLVEVVHFRPEQADAIPRTGFDLYLSVDDDTEHRLPPALQPRACWAIDTHRDFPARLRLAAGCDLVFAAQRDGAERLKAAGIESALWLPLACDPEIHRRHEVPIQYDVAFVGHVFPGPREELLRAIAGRFPRHFIGRAFFDEMARTYSASRVVFNRSIGNDINMRVFEALACGSLLVTNDLAQNGQDELFGDRVHLATYREAPEGSSLALPTEKGDRHPTLGSPVASSAGRGGPGASPLFPPLSPMPTAGALDVIAYYLEHPDEREAIAAAGRSEAVGRHTYRHRMERLLAEADRRLGRTVATVPVGPGAAAEDTKAGHRAGLASVIVPVCNQWEFTRLCVQSLFRFTRPGSWELIVVDNGSTDGTAAYLAGVQDVSDVPITVITNPRNVGFPAAINQGLQVAGGESLVLLNNDAVVTDGWLDQLIALSRVRVEDGGGTGGRGTASAGIGLVGPMSNYASPPQLVEGVPYRDLDEMHAFARRWRDEHRGRWFTAAKLSGFCLLMTRAAYQAVGGLDERFGLGMFDDDDLAIRARRAGFELAVAHDLFVHHFGSRTFAGNGIDAEGLLEENARRFGEKWGIDGAAGRRVGLRPWSGEAAARDRGGSRAASRRGAEDGVPRAARVSLTMIVRDEEQNLPHCLESVRGVFDEIVVVDTGSVDRTREVARDFGAKVFEFAWIDDFAAARNAALGHATGDYAFWLDADDVVEPDQRQKLVALLEGLGSGSAGRAGGKADPTRSDGVGPESPTDGHGPAAYVVRCACDPGADGSGGETVVDHVRLFPLRPDVRWTYRVHEQIMPALRRAGIPVRWTDLVVRHTGYVDVALRARKLDRDARILREELKGRPDEPFVLFNLGAIAVERKDWPAALDYLGRSLAHSAPSDSITRKLFALIARAHQMLDDSAAALRVCAEGLSFDPDDAELLFRMAVLHRHRGERAEAERCWRTILGLRRPEKFASVDMGIYGHRTRRNLAAMAAERGDREEEARLWAEVLAECPGDREALAKLQPVAPKATE